MGSLLVRLSDEHRARLEAYRAANGLRSLNAAVIHLIETRGGTAKPYMDPADAAFFAAKEWPKAALIASPQRKAAQLVINRTASSAVQLGPVKPKPGERLKKK